MKGCHPGSWDRGWCWVAVSWSRPLTSERQLEKRRGLRLTARFEKCALQHKQRSSFYLMSQRWSNKFIRLCEYPQKGGDPCEGGICRAVFLWLGDELSQANQVHVCSVKGMSLSESEVYAQALFTSNRFRVSGAGRSIGMCLTSELRALAELAGFYI